MKTIGENDLIIGELIARRRSLGWPQWRVAEVMGSNQTALSFWETGTRQPTLQNLVRWAGALGCRFRLHPGERVAASRAGARTAKRSTESALRRWAD